MVQYVVLFLSFFLMGMAPPRTDARVEIPAKTMQVVKMVGDHERKDGSIKRYPYCTGFVIGNDRIMTAKHCIDADNISVQFQNDTESSCEVESQGKQMPNEDWATLKCETYGVMALKKAKKWPTLPYLTYYTSYRSGELIIIPVMLDKYAGENGYLTIEYTGISLGGDSGSPLFNAAGEVIGIVTRSGASYGDPLGLAVPFIYLPEF
jgi:S1-C subfamily serine protease